MNLILKSLEKPCNTPVAAVIAQAQAELVAKGYSDGSDSVDWTCKVFYAEVDGKIAGLICWKVSEWMQEASITLGYVLPEFRRQGIYSQLFGALEAEATKLKLRSISGYTHVNNTALQKTALRQGRELFMMGYRKRLPLISETITGGSEATHENDQV